MVTKGRNRAENKDKAEAEGTDEELLFDASPDAFGASGDAEIEDIEESAEERVQKYKEKLALCRKERQEYLDGWQRAKADYLNSKRRLEAERAADTERTTARFVETLLPLADSFDLALNTSHTGKAGREASGDWHAGLAQIHSQLHAILTAYGVTALDPKGAVFDPRFHEAISEATVTDAADDHIIISVLQRGYLLGERLIRPAKVVVGTHRDGKNG